MAHLSCRDPALGCLGAGVFAPAGCAFPCLGGFFFGSGVPGVCVCAGGGFSIDVLLQRIVASAGPLSNDLFWKNLRIGSAR